MRKADLGKWYISVQGVNYDEIGKAVNAIIKKTLEEIPAFIHKLYPAFLTQTRILTIKGTSYKPKTWTFSLSSNYQSWLTTDIIVTSIIMDFP